MARGAGASHFGRPLLRARHVRFCQVLDCLASLDEHARKFLTASAPTDQPDLAPALVQQGLQLVLLKRQRSNPSRPCQEFRQGLSRISPSPGHFGQVRAGRWWPFSRAPGKSAPPVIPPAGAGADPSRACPESGLGIRRDCPRQPITHWPRPGPAGEPANGATGHRLVPV